MATSLAGRRVYVHIGLPKTGTTFLQTSMLENQQALREVGVHYPGGDERMFLAAVDVRGSHKAWGRKRSAVDGQWDALTRQARGHDGATVLSQELLAAASPRRVTAAMTMLKGLDVHVVVTARDPARQAAAEWQEGVKHGRRLSFEEFRTRVLDEDADTDYARRYRAAQDLPEVLARWADAVPAAHVHVVCGPPPGAPTEVLWRRFGEVVGFDATRFAPAGAAAANTSLGTDEVDLLRRVNLALAKRVEQPAYGEVVKGLYAGALLDAGRSARPVVPADMHDAFTVVGERWVKAIDRAGYTVHGDPADLLPRPPSGPVRHPDDVDPVAQVRVATAATAELLVELRRTRDEVVRLEADNQRLRRRRKRLKRQLRGLDTAGATD